MALAILVKFQALAGADVSIKPNPNALPGMPTAEKLANGLAALVLLCCAIGALFGVAQWALGSHASNYSQADAGKKKVGVCIGGAFVVGALAAIINFAVTTGGSVK